MEKINILGVNITNASQAEILNRINEFFNSKKQHFIVTPNPEIILQATEKDEELHYILNHADLALADGVALKFAGWFYGKNIRRATGADIMVEILKLAQRENRRVAIFNWQGGLSAKTEIKRALADKFPGLKFFVQDIERSGPYYFEAVNKFAPDIIISGLGFPYQEKFIYYNLGQMPSAKLGLSVGGSFDYLTGKIQRAPKITRRLGLEWLWRLRKQPKRWRRIFGAIIIFPFRFFIFFSILRWFYRKNVACLLYKKEQAYEKEKYKIIIVERAGDKGHWQMPQGGTDRESLPVSGARELKEELNTEKFKPIAAFKNLFKYKFNKRFDNDGLPTEYQPMKNQRGYKGQKQSLFIAEFTGLDRDIKINFWEHSAWRWVDAERLIESVHPIRREAAKIFMDKFWLTVKK